MKMDIALTIIGRMRPLFESLDDTFVYFFMIITIEIVLTCQTI